MALTAYCKKCAREVEPGAVCPYCGTKLGKTAAHAAWCLERTPVKDWMSWNAVMRVLLPAGLAVLLQQFQTLRPVRYAFWGIRAGVLALILRALWMMYRQCPKSGWAYALMGLAFICTAVLKFSVLPVILLCAGLGLAAHALRERRQGS